MVGQLSSMELETLGSYEILREWGRSPAGRILLAHDSETQAQVRIQLFDTSDITAADGREASDAVRGACGPLVGVDHPNLATVFDVDEEGGVPYVVSEHLEGTPFDVHCRTDSRLAPALACDLVASSARGLHEAHGVGVVHGRICPRALIRVDEATAKITDFGLAVLPHAGEGSVRGAPGYLAPEQIRDAAPSALSDQFALASVLYELLTGDKAFPGESVSAVLYRTVHEAPRDPRELEPRIPAELASIVLRGLAQRPEERWESCQRFAEALEAASISLSVDLSLAPARPAPAPGDPRAPRPAPAVPPPAVHPGPSRTAVWPFAVAAALVATSAAVTFVVLRHEGPAEPRPAPWLEVRVRTEPPGLPVLLDGRPIVATESGLLRFQAGEPPGLLAASLGCRTAQHRLAAADANGEVVLVPDPVEIEVRVEAPVADAGVLLGGRPAGTAPVDLRLDLCRPQRIELVAPGYRGQPIEIPAGVSPLEARKLVADLTLELIPRGRLVLPASGSVELAYYVDGKRLDATVRELEIEEGRHDLRFTNDYHWIDVTLPVEVVAGQTITPVVEPQLATLAVQAFPSNCKVYLRRGGEAWRYFEETPAERRVAAGRYEIKVQSNSTGATRTAEVDLEAGPNPPVRVSFGGAG